MKNHKPISPTPQIPDYLQIQEKSDFALYTDGSGYNDGLFGGSAAVLLSVKNQVYETVAAGFSHTTVERAEFDALLMGLQRIIEVMDWNNGPVLRRLEVRPAIVYWFSDREALVKSVNGEYGHHASKDLWARYDYYSRYFDVKGYYVPRDTVFWQNTTDRLSSEARILFKEWYEAIQTDGDI